MPIDLPVLLAALLAGLVGGLHCVAMCGGVAAGVSLATRGAPPLRSALIANAGRILGYVLMGVLVGGFGAGLLQVVQVDALLLGMRMAVGAVLILVALRLLDTRNRLGFLSRPGAALWQRLAPLQRRLLPATTLPRQLALGVLWGWLPCGLSYTLLTAAWLTADALHGGLLMAAFGLGTAATIVPLTWSGARAAQWLSRPGARLAASALVFIAGALTLAGPWLAKVPALHTALEALGCRTLGQ
jgi:uncharacterized protein